MALFARKPLLFAAVLCLAQGLGLLTPRDAALLAPGLSDTPTAASLFISCLVVIAAATLPGAAILLAGAEKGLALGLAGLVAYGVFAWSWQQAFQEVLPVLAPGAAWYVSQILGLGWQAHADQRVDDILPVEQRGVFISYRRALDEVTARMLKQELTARGFDVFLDVDDLGHSSRFDRTLAEQIEQRSSFVLVLSPGALDRCSAEDDWLRHEIAHALKTERKVIPVTRGGFQLERDDKLPPEIAALPLHNAVTYSSTFHRAAIGLLVTYLCTPSTR